MTAAKRAPAKWVLYILQCRDGTFYTGITNNLTRRLDQHNKGKASRYTRVRVPVELIYKEACRDRSSALRKECMIKALKREAKEMYIKNNGGRCLRQFKR